MSATSMGSQLDLESQFESPPCVQSSALLPLPPEIHTMIYHHILPSSARLQPPVHRIFLDTQRAEQGEGYRDNEKVLSLARTCQYFYNSDFIAIYFGQNTFSFDNAYDLYRYLYMIGDRGRRYLKSIEVCLRSVSEDAYVFSVDIKRVTRYAFNLLADCKLLRKLYIGVLDTTTSSMTKNRGNLIAFAGSGCFSAVRGLQQLDLRVREVSYKSPWTPDLFERESCSGTYKLEYIQAFESFLLAEMTSPKIKPGNKTDESEDPKGDCLGEEQVSERDRKHRKTMKASKQPQQGDAKERRAPKRKALSPKVNELKESR
ncbi:hypothetical protein G7Y89_g3657 [Cudoniella acicularis]|uniref:Uncharacterized protein n=1 Tax=Cudoniella acicularis TaxID=354080 RepID=A0A8H4RST3_9HELO|nr:hypothetical protein G7Y89_g3657 [Cudoniella acicularis]